jgi:hypothetical protein
MNSNDEIYKIFKRVILGDLQPHKVDENNLSKLNDLFSIRIGVNDNNFNIKECRYMTLLEYKKIEISIDDQNYNHTFAIKEDEQLEDLIDIDIPPPKDKKSELYLDLAKHEYELVKKIIQNHIKTETSINSLELFALKNINELKEVAKELYMYGEKIRQTDDYQVNKYIVSVFKHYLVMLIFDIQRVFATFFKIKSQTIGNLRYELYNENHIDIFQMPLLSIYPLLPNNPKYNKLKEYIKTHNSAIKDQTEKNNSLGVKIYNFFKLEFGKDIDSFIDEKIFWEELLAANKLKVLYIDKYINHPEIENILIPLFNKKIEYLRELNNSVEQKDEFNFPKLTQNIIDILVKMSKRDNRNKAENILNDYLSDFLQERHYNTDNQARMGNKLIDIEIQKKDGTTISIIEGFKLSGLNRNVIYEHVYKLLNNYDKTGNAVNYVVIYCESDNYVYLQEEYFKFLSEINHYNSGLNYDVKLFKNRSGETGKSDIFFAETIHNRNGNEVSLYHLIINLNK